jgi:AcrR family transcriptional regulator
MVSGRGDATRERLLDVSEELFGEFGVFNVSLRQIRLAARERNTAAMQYYFVDRDGLILTLIDRHVSRVGIRRQSLWDELVDRDLTHEPRQLVELLVRPYAEYVELGTSERAWIKIMAELGSQPDAYWHEVVGLTTNTVDAAGKALYTMMRSTLPQRIARERLFVGARMAVNVCSDRARRIESPSSRGKPLPTHVFIDNLSNMLNGALFAPLSISRVKPKTRGRG